VPAGPAQAAAAIGVAGDTALGAADIAVEAPVTAAAGAGPAEEEAVAAVAAGGDAGKDQDGVHKFETRNPKQIQMTNLGRIE
jgi:hypothetical protein